jgi:hypothetical protein
MDDDKTTGSFSKFWGYYQIISFLAEEKIWKMDFVTNTRLVFALNHLSYLMDLNKEKEKLIKEHSK